MIALALAAVLAVPVLAQDAPAPDDHWDARLTAVTGEVVVHPHDGGDEAAGETGMPLEDGDRVTTSAGAEAEIALDDGSLITLRENSDFTLESTRKDESVFSLALGSMLAKIQKLGSQSLSIRTPAAVAAVRGTEFGVDVEDGQSHVGVFDEGRVEVTGSGGKQVLTPNQETSVARGAAPARPRPLQRFLARRARMRAQIRRLRVIRRSWKRLPPAERAARRQAALTRLRALRRQRRQTLQQRRGEKPLRRRRPFRRQQPRRRPSRKPAPGERRPGRKR